MNKILIAILLAWISNSSYASLIYKCSVTGLVFKAKTLVSFTSPFTKEVILKEISGGYHTDTVNMFVKSGLDLRLTLSSFNGNTDMTIYVYDLNNNLLATSAGISQDSKGNVAEFIGTHFYNADSSVSSLMAECKIK